jgi:hypothetical protein
MYSDPPIITAATNRNLLQPTKENKRRRKSQIQAIQNDTKGKHRSDSSSNGESSHAKLPIPKFMRNQSSTSSSSGKSNKSQLVDLVVEDYDAEQVDRVRARKEGGPGWNEVPTKHFV